MKEIIRELRKAYAQMNKTGNLMVKNKDKIVKKHGYEMIGASNQISEWIEEIKGE